MRLLQMDDMAWFIIQIPRGTPCKSFDLFFRIIWTIGFCFLDWLKPELTKFGRFWMIRCGKGIVPSDSLVPDDLEYFPPEMSYCGLIIKMQEIILGKSVWCGLGQTVCRIHFKLKGVRYDLNDGFSWKPTFYNFMD